MVDSTNDNKTHCYSLPLNCIQQFLKWQHAYHAHLKEGVSPRFSLVPSTIVAQRVLLARMELTLRRDHYICVCFPIFLPALRTSPLTKSSPKSKVR
jgi:hypothetical protein